MIADIVFRLRLFSRHPGLSGTAMLLLAIGISAAGVGHDVFTAVTSPPVADSNRVARLGTPSPAGLPGVGPLPSHHLEELQDFTTSFSEIVAAEYRTGTLWDESGTLASASQIRVARVTSGFFDLVGATPQLGRGFEPEDHRPGAPGILILSHGLWRRWSGSDPALIGRQVTLDGDSFVVGGIMPRGVRFPMADAWVAVSEADLRARPDLPVSVFARLRPDRTWGAARAEIAAVAPRMAALHPRRLSERALRLLTLQEEGRSRRRVAALGALGPPLLLLFLCCFTVGNLALAEAVEREREVAVRVALGACRPRLARQFLTEAAVLAVPAGLLGLALMNLELWLLRVAAPPPMQWLTDSLAIRPSTWVFVTGVTGMTPLLFGLAPFVGSLRVDVSGGMRQTSRARLPVWNRYTIRDLAVILQIALAVVVVASFAFMRTVVWSAVHPELGFDPEGLGIVRVRGEGRGDEAPRLLLPGGFLDRVRGLPGVEAVTLADEVPRPSRIKAIVSADGSSGPQTLSRRTAVGGSFFPTLGVRLLQGRGIRTEDCLAARDVAVASEALARTLWPGQDVIGRSVVLLDEHGRTEATLEIVGLAPDLAYSVLEPASRNAIYVPLDASGPDPGPTIALVRAPGRLGAVAPGVSDVLRDSGWPGARAGVLRPFREATEADFADSLFMLDLFGTVGLLGSLLAIVGVVSVTVEAVRLHTRELGIRAALGASPSDLVRLVLRSSLTRVAFGVVLGLPGPLVYHLSSPWTAVDPSAVLASPLAWGVVGATLISIILASWGAARGAARADPAVAMRAE